MELHDQCIQLLLFLSWFHPGSGLQCYKCMLRPLTRQRNETIWPCTKFNPSESFVVDCPYSTYCMKRTVLLGIGYGETINTTIRDCAPQAYSYTEIINGKWAEIIAINEDLYSEGCSLERRPLISTTTESCFCSTSLCNSAPRTFSSPSLLLVGLPGALLTWVFRVAINI